MKAIFLYDYTGLMARPWLDAGYECWLFDGQHPEGVTREGNLVKVGMWFDPYKLREQAIEIADMLGEGVVHIFSFPECTHLTNAGSGSWAKKRAENPRFQDEAVVLAKLAPAVGALLGCHSWAAENPVGKLSTLWRKPDFWFDPCDFGGYLPMDDTHPIYPEIYPPRDAYNKKTGIWAGAGYVKPFAKRVEPAEKDNPGWAKCGGKSTRTKNIRSATPRGFAIANFEANARHLKDLV